MGIFKAIVDLPEPHKSEAIRELIKFDAKHNTDYFSEILERRATLGKLNWSKAELGRSYWKYLNEGDYVNASLIYYKERPTQLVKDCANALTELMSAIKDFHH